MRIFLLVLAACLLALSESARPAIRPRVREPQVYYEEDNQAAEDDFESVYHPRTRALPSARSKEALQPSKAPPVQTIRNYNKVNDDGSFTFGYEAADGSFKEETRGTDCVVRGKYGYIDPDGNKREFTYVSGNPCDPNAPKEEEEDLPEKQEDDDLSGPANYPSVRPVPIRPIRPTYQPTTARTPTAIFQTQYQLDDEASQELEEEVQKPVQLRPTAFRKPQQSYVQVSPSTALYDSTPTTSPSQLYRLASTSNVQYQTTAVPSERPPSTISPLAYQSLETSTRKAVTRHQVRPQSVAITPRPHIAQVAAQYVSPSSTERSIPYSAQSRPTPSTSTHLRTSVSPSSSAHLNFAAELERYVNTVGVPSKSTQQAALSPSRTKLGQTTVTTVPAEPIYQSELIYDPATAQPQSLLGLQQLQQIQQHQQQSQQQPQRQSAVYKQHVTQPVQSASISAVSVAQPQELLYRKQQTQLLMQSQNLYAQQQQRRQQQQQQPQQQQPHKLQLLESQRDPQAFYYVAPLRSSGAAAGAAAGTPLTASQIDQYLRSSSANNY
ncbi:ras-interacting protein RIP3-like isoform X2 [Vespa crabro]|uniref:ras-interacting protein RIP3-like isoform X2 n=1 Tax=Vespa crabro TaxID=7445 RepID=UPI001EFF7A0D|nr:ras-interacting protein RIP3-like isoform X2 [Vespa crabro]